MGRSMEIVSPYQSASPRRVLLTTAFVSVAVVVALLVQNFGIPRALGDDGRPASLAADYPLREPDPADERAPSALYAGIMWSVLGVDVGPATSTGFVGRSTVSVHLQLRNTLEVTSLRASDGMLSLQAADLPDIANGRFIDADRRISLAPGETRTATAVFTVTFSATPDPAAFTLQIAEAGRVPALIPLVGPAPAPTPPVSIRGDRSGTTLPDPDRAGRQIVVEPVGATIDVNAGPYRAAANERLAVVKLDLQRASISADSTFLTPAYWALRSSAGTSPAVLVSRGDTVGSNADELTVVLTYPADATQLELVAAANRPEAAAIPLLVPGA